MFEKLKKKWDIESNWDFFLIMAVFSLAGMSVTLVRKPFFHLLGFNAQTPMWLKTITYIAFVMPFYQLSSLFFAFFLRQFDFFWNKQKEIGRAIKKAVLKRRITSNR